MSTLTKPAIAYVRDRRKRGEITQRTGRNMEYALAKLDASFGDRPLDRFGRRSIERWLESIAHLAPATRRLHLSVVRGFCRHLVERGLIDRDPSEHIAPIRQPRTMPRTLTPSEVAALYRAAPDQRARAIIALMVGCGLRCVEVSRLDVADYDPDRRTIEVRGKGQHERVVPMPVETVEEVERYLADVGARSGPMIRSTRTASAPLGAGTISIYMSRMAWDAGVKRAAWDGRSAHGLRRTAASDVLDACGDLALVADMLGHRGYGSLPHYLRRASVEKMRGAMDGRSYRDAA